MFKKVRNRKIVAVIVMVFWVVPLLFGCGKEGKPTINPNDPMVKQFTTIANSLEEPKNIILMIGDGMGPNQVKIPTELTGGHYEGKAFMQYLPNQGFAKTMSHDGVTDSAAAGTALATGFKTRNGVIGKDNNGNEVMNLVELATRKGMRTGVITTKAATDATPAVFTAHAENRGDQIGIAAQQLKHLPNVLIGTGLEYYEIAKTNASSLQSNLDKKNITHLTTLEALKQANTDGEYLLCTTEESENIDLVLATEKSLALLNKEDDKGFFLMIEGGKIDSYGHANEMDGLVDEFMEFDKCVGLVMEFMIQNPDTLLIVTADHETGDLQYVEGGNPIYRFGDIRHSGAEVPIFAAGTGTEFFKDKSMENTEIAKFIAEKMGNKYFGGK